MIGNIQLDPESLRVPPAGPGSHKIIEEPPTHKQPNNRLQILGFPFDLFPKLLQKVQPFPPGAKLWVCPRSCCRGCWERRYQRSSSSELLRKRHNWCFSNSQNSPSEPWNQLRGASGSSGCLWSHSKIHCFILICSSIGIGRRFWWSSWALRLCLASPCRGFHPFPSLWSFVVSEAPSGISLP